LARAAVGHLTFMKFLLFVILIVIVAALAFYAIRGRSRRP
jgi:hypothetical protein